MLIRVYCRGNKEEKTLLWKELKACKNKCGGKWIVGEDSNIVLKRSKTSVIIFLEHVLISSKNNSIS